MAGQNIARLRSAIMGMNPEAVDDAQRGWNTGADTLDQIVFQLLTTEDDLNGAFAPTSAVRQAAAEVLATVRNGVSKDRDRMLLAGSTLVDVATVMRQTQSKAHAMPAEAPGSPPKVEGGPFEDDADEVNALKVYASRSRMYNQQVNAYNESDADAAAQVEQLNRTYDRAADVFEGMHGDEGDRKKRTNTNTNTNTAGTGGGGGFTTRPHSYTTTHSGSTAGYTATGLPHAGTGTGTHHPGSGQFGGTDTGGTGTGGAGTGGTDGPQIDPSGKPPSFGPGTFENVDDPSTGPSAGPFGSPLAPGAAGVGGVLGGLGLRGLLSGSATSSSSVSVPGQRVSRGIGASTRSGAGSVLGRSGATGRGGPLAPGQQTSRGAAGRGVGSAGGRGRGKKDDEDDAEKEIYDVERDWTDDEGQYPGVIG